MNQRIAQDCIDEFIDQETSVAMRSPEAAKKITDSLTKIGDCCRALGEGIARRENDTIDFFRTLRVPRTLKGYRADCLYLLRDAARAEKFAWAHSMSECAFRKMAMDVCASPNRQAFQPLLNHLATEADFFQMETLSRMSVVLAGIRARAFGVLAGRHEKSKLLISENDVQSVFAQFLLLDEMCQQMKETIWSEWREPDLLRELLEEESAHFV